MPMTYTLFDFKEREREMGVEVPGEKEPFEAQETSTAIAQVKCDAPDLVSFFSAERHHALPLAPSILPKR